MSKGTTDTGWQASARRQLRNQRAAWIGTFVTIAIGGGLFGASVQMPDTGVRTLLLATSLLAMVGGLIWSTLIYMRVIDEQERDANLWATYVGLLVYMTLYAVLYLCGLARVAVPLTHDGIFLATSVTTLIIFVWKRFY